MVKRTVLISVDQCLINTSAVSAYFAVKNQLLYNCRESSTKKLFFAKQSQTYTAWAIWAIPTPVFAPKINPEFYPSRKTKPNEPNSNPNEPNFWAFPLTIYVLF
jgi:hypothetical protein